MTGCIQLGEGEGEWFPIIFCPPGDLTFSAYAFANLSTIRKTGRQGLHSAFSIVTLQDGFDYTPGGSAELKLEWYE